MIKYDDVVKANLEKNLDEYNRYVDLIQTAIIDSYPIKMGLDGKKLEIYFGKFDWKIIHLINDTQKDYVFTVETVHPSGVVELNLRRVI